jgi:SulP family sulfate permease
MNPTDSSASKEPESTRPAAQRRSAPPAWWSFFPILATAKSYQLADLRSDIPASLTVALMNIPQAIAYATIAGLPPVYGIYASIVLTAICSLLCNSQHLISGPTNAISLVVAGALLTAGSPAVRENPVQAVILLTFMVGVIQLGFGLLKVGSLAQFISRSVLIGFTTGAGLLIALNQVPVLLGLSLPPVHHLLARFSETFRHITEINWYALALGGGTLAALYAGKKWLPRWPTALLTLSLAGAIVWMFDLQERGVKIASELPAALPHLVPPTFNLGMVADLAGAAIAIAILGCVESLSIAKSISLSSGQRMNNNQDFLGLGISHLIGSFFQCMPGCGSFTRSALNFSAGARTRMSGIFCAIWVSILLLLLAPLAKTIPTASLAGLLIYLGLGLINWEHIRSAVFATKSDASVLLLTFFCTLFLHLDTAIYIGVLASLVLFLRKASAPHLVEYNMDDDSMREIRDPKERANPEISIIHVEGELFFGAAEMFEEQVRYVAKDKNIRVVILRLKNARHLDATAVHAIDGLHSFLKNDHRLLLISGAPPEVIKVMQRSRLIERLGEENVFPAEENLTVATRRALLRAKEFLGTTASPDVRIFYDKSRGEKK